jgi:DNA-directed RNA polymerases I, II, and III subunit RPABC4
MSQSASNNHFGTSTSLGLGDDRNPNVTVAYRCMECDTSVKLNKGDAIRCSGCGHRVLYKERTKNMVQLEAR